MTEPAGPMLTLAEAAAYIRRRPRTLQNLLYSGRGPRSYRVAGQRLFRAADLDAWINKHAVKPGRRAA